ncbi:DUF4158 domain-containing protein [Streptomyces glaucus]|uniref:DUF4158 domain-containing protein n=1 Tax=Streptomyces glaucus TaxID=284029 RepID=A0ABN3JX53_9ACTN
MWVGPGPYGCGERSPARTIKDRGPYPVDLDELVEHWTLLKDEQGLVSGKRGATRLGFAVLPKFYTQYGRFPRGRYELPADAVEFVARQAQVPASELDSYEWTGRTIEYHRARIRGRPGFRECSVADADKLTTWLAEHVACKEQRPEQVRVELLARCRTESIEPPTSGRCDRIAGAALRAVEETLTARISARLTAESTKRIVALVSGADQADDAVPGEASTSEGGDGPPTLGRIKEAPGNVSLETMLTGIDNSTWAPASTSLPSLCLAPAHRRMRGAAKALPSRLSLSDDDGMTLKRVVLVVTCVVVAVLGWMFTVSQWETASRIATVASALAGVAAVGVGIWAALPGASQSAVVVRETSTAKSAGKGNAVTGYHGGGSTRPVTVERTGDAEATGDGDAISGYSDK